MSHTVLDRIDARLQALGLKPATASRAAGLSADAIRNLQAGKAGSPTLRTVEALAPVLGTTPEWLAFGSGPEVLDDSIPPAMPVPLPVPRIAWVAASRFFEVADATTQTNADIVPCWGLPAGGRFVALSVRGDSMNRVAEDGATIIVNLKDRELYNKKYYVFQDVDHETTFKRFMRAPDRLDPYSTNPEHMPIPMSDSIRVLGRVVRVMQDL